MYGTGAQLAELDQKYPNRPHNHARTLPFSELYRTLFNPLNEAKKPTAGGGGAKAGPHGASRLSHWEQRRVIIERFMRRWRDEVGNDIYPALRLILPDKDRDRGMYGLKENAIGKLLVKLTKIDRNSEDGYGLLHWKLPGATAAARYTSGDFAGRCFEVLSKRPMRTEPGNLTIADVNELLDRLAGASGEAEQLPIFEIFYQNMNAEELTWLIRIILREMKVGATERTFLDIWHPDAEALFSVSSSLRRVCWELWDPSIRLEQEETGVTLMQCFQPQLAQFQLGGSFQRMVQYLRPTDDDPEFWIEEKLDGERMQMHVVSDPSLVGGYRFAFWSRKAKDYTYLYGSSLDPNEPSALTRHLSGVFDEGVRNIILDGEMITWDPEVDKIVPFGTLKTAALSERDNPVATHGQRPLLRVFDCLYLNDKPLTAYTLRDRRRALERAVRGVHRRLEVHPYVAATSADAIEPMLRQVVAEASEGLVLKNPRSPYRLNSRNDDWLKVKPEYMSEFGESLDCVIIGGYYGSGRRGGTLSSFLCGLRVGANAVAALGADPERCLSFFKVGGGLRAEDYAEIAHRTEGRWHDWDPANPPTKYMELAPAGGNHNGQKQQKYAEQPDVWIRPSESVVIEAKAASVGPSDSFATGFTLRFPRFRRLRLDKKWDDALDVDEFRRLRAAAEEEAREKQMEVEENRRNRRRGDGPSTRKKARRDIVIAGQEDAPGLPGTDDDATAAEDVFGGLQFAVLSDALPPEKKTKAQLEALVKRHGGTVTQQADLKAAGTTIFIADKRVVKVASLQKAAGEAGVDIVRPRWVLDCLATPNGRNKKDGYRLPLEEHRHLLDATPQTRAATVHAVDRFGDSFARDVDLAELRTILEQMSVPDTENGGEPFDREQFMAQLDEHGHGDILKGQKGNVFRRCVVSLLVGPGCGDVLVTTLGNYIRFGGGRVLGYGDVGTAKDADKMDGDYDEDEKAASTHVVILVRDGDVACERELAATARYDASRRRKRPRIVTAKWVTDCWAESTLIDEERYVPI